MRRICHSITGCKASNMSFKDLPQPRHSTPPYAARSALSNCERLLCLPAQCWPILDLLGHTHILFTHIWIWPVIQSNKFIRTRADKLARGHPSMRWGKAFRLRPISLLPPLLAMRKASAGSAALAASISRVVRPAEALSGPWQGRLPSLIRLGNSNWNVVPCAWLTEITCLLQRDDKPQARVTGAARLSRGTEPAGSTRMMFNDLSRPRRTLGHAYCQSVSSFACRLNDGRSSISDTPVYPLHESFEVQILELMWPDQQ